MNLHDLLPATTSPTDKQVEMASALLELYNSYGDMDPCETEDGSDCPGYHRNECNQQWHRWELNAIDRLTAAAMQIITAATDEQLDHTSYRRWLP